MIYGVSTPLFKFKFRVRAFQFESSLFFHTLFSSKSDYSFFQQFVSWFVLGLLLFGLVSVFGLFQCLPIAQ